MEIQRVKTVILIEKIEHADPQLRVAMREAVADNNIVLPEIVARTRTAVAGIFLMIPSRLPLRERATAMMEIRRERKLVQQPALIAFQKIQSRGRVGNFRKALFNFASLTR